MIVKKLMLLARSIGWNWRAKLPQRKLERLQHRAEIDFRFALSVQARLTFACARRVRRRQTLFSRSGQQRSRLLKRGAADVSMAALPPRLAPPSDALGFINSPEDMGEVSQRRYCGAVSPPNLDCDLEDALRSQSLEVFDLGGLLPIHAARSASRVLLRQGPKPNIALYELI